MSNALVNFYHNLEEPIIIYDKKLDILYHNISFKKIFGDFNNSKGYDCLLKLVFRFSYQMCFLKSEDLKTYCPPISAIKEKSNFTTFATYQKDENTFYHFIIKAFSVKRYRIVYFYDITKDLQTEKLKEENERLRIQNIEFASTNSKAQNQAIKMALLNRISISIKNELNIKTLIEKSLKELSIVFGANKSYYIEFNRKDAFVIKYTYPEVFEPQINENVIYSKKILDKLHAGVNSIQTCIKEYENAPIPLLNPTTRIIMPILNNSQLIGAAVIFTPKKEITALEKELLVGISMVVSSSLIQASLFHEISQKKEELEEAIKELKETQLQLINSEKMASLGQLIASVAHEINTPLGSINANNEMMEKVFDDFDIKNLDILKEMNSIDKEAIKRITNIVQSLKRFVRLDETVQQEANINQELELTLELLRHKTKRGFEIIKEFDAVPYVNCYPNMLNQVFLNILMNSIHSIEEIKSKDSSYTGKIKLKTYLEEDYLRIDIFDNGKGISENIKNKIFDAGFTTKKKGEGTGLGLAICKKIIEKHNGKIIFNSNIAKEEPEYNTVFSIEIPI